MSSGMKQTAGCLLELTDEGAVAVGESVRNKLVVGERQGSAARPDAISVG